MAGFLYSLRNAIRNLARPEPGIRFGGEDIEALPSILPGHWYAAYQLGMHYRDSTWYFDRHFERKIPCGHRDWPESGRR